MQNKLFLISCFLFLSLGAQSQFLNDEAAKKTVASSLDKLYNEEWALADKMLAPVFVKYSTHPVSNLIRALQLQMRYVPIESSPVKLKAFLKELEQCKVRASQLIKNPDLKSEATFYLLAAHGYIAQAYHNQGELLKAATEGRKAYGYMKDGFELGKMNPEFFFTNGLYNYYREQYPETHPEIKPLIIFFAKGDKRLGLSELNKARNQALFTKNEAAFFLLGVNLKYESDFTKALNVSKSLYTQYPQNQLYTIKYIESLIAAKQIEKAEQLIRSKLIGDSELTRLSRLLFLGQCEADHDKAKAYYASSIKVPATGRFIEDYKSMAYLGLAQRFYLTNDFNTSRLMLKKAESLAEYEWVKKEVEALTQKLK